jgi:8-oxo-dGTP pyrophosphatase MutT (NUDIX family)
MGRERDVTLYEDAVRVLGEWVAPDEEQAAVRDRFLELLGSSPDVVLAQHPEAHLTASVMLVRADLSQVLLCLHGKVRRWVQLGGHLEPGDPSLVAAGLREATEESGIAGIVVHPVPIGLDIHPVTCRSGPSYHYDVRFAGLAPDGAVEAVSPESLRLAWFAPDELPEPLASATAPLVGPAIAAFRSGAGRPAP